jgi:toxin YoeB
LCVVREDDRTLDGGAAQDYRWFRARDPRMATRIDRLIEDIKRRPFAGIGKPEPLRGTLTGWWSRRIAGEHRLVYRVVGKSAARELHIARCRYHC